MDMAEHREYVADMVTRSGRALPRVTEIAAERGDQVRRESAAAPETINADADFIRAIAAVLEGMSKVHREVVKAADRQPQGRFQRWSQRRELRKSVSRLEHGVAGF